MATITVRELSRNAKEVFDDLEANGAPLVITRNGLPVAALVSIDPQEAEAYLLAAAPELVADRKMAEEVVAQGGTVPLADALLEFESEPQENEAVEPGAAWRDLGPLIGFNELEVFERKAAQFTQEVAQEAIQAVGVPSGMLEGARGEKQQVLQQLNERLFGRKFRDEILRASQGSLAAFIAGDLKAKKTASDGLLERGRVDMVFTGVTGSVYHLNRTLIDRSSKQRDPLVAFQLIESGLEISIASLD